MGEHPTCYVCGRPIRENALRVPGPAPGEGLWRHPSRCKPGSAAYLANRKLARAYQAEFREPRAVRLRKARAAEEGAAPTQA